MKTSHFFKPAICFLFFNLYQLPSQAQEFWSVTANGGENYTESITRFTLPDSTYETVYSFLSDTSVYNPINQLQD